MSYLGGDETKIPFGRLQRLFMDVEGVIAVTGDAVEVQVTAYAPHVSTGKLLETLKVAGCEAEVRIETVVLRARPDADLIEKKLETACTKLSLVPGVIQVKAGKDGTLELTREKGRASLANLNHFLKDTGWSVE